MKKVILFIAVLSLTFVSCSKDETVEEIPVNNFANTEWVKESLGFVTTYKFINQNECQIKTDYDPTNMHNIFTYNYTFDDNKAFVVDKETGETYSICTISGNTMTIRGSDAIYDKVN